MKHFYCILNWIIEYQHQYKVSGAVYKIPGDSCNPPGKAGAKAIFEASATPAYDKIGNGAKGAEAQAIDSRDDGPKEG